jgi:hypothetical protein
MVCQDLVDRSRTWQGENLVTGCLWRRGRFREVGCVAVYGFVSTGRGKRHRVSKPGQLGELCRAREVTTSPARGAAGGRVDDVTGLAN